MFRRATVGSATGGTAPQGKVAGASEKPRMGVSRASGYNLAAFALGSVRCRDRSPDHGTPKLPRLPRRTERAVARDGECGTCSIDAHAGKRAGVRKDSEAGNGRIGGDV